MDIEIMTYLQQLHFHCGHRILNPFADFGMSALTNRIVVFSRLDERSLRIDVSFAQNGMNGHYQEITVGADDGLIRVQHWDIHRHGSHDDSFICITGVVICEQSSAVYT